MCKSEIWYRFGLFLYFTLRITFFMRIGGNSTWASRHSFTTRDNSVSAFFVRTPFEADIFDFCPQLNVVGLLFSWPWPCLSSLLDFLIVDPLGKTVTIVLVLFSYGPLFKQTFLTFSLNLMLWVSFSPGRDRACRHYWISSLWTPSGNGYYSVSVFVRTDPFLSRHFLTFALTLMLWVSFSPGRDHACRHYWISSLWTHSGKRLL